MKIMNPPVVAGQVLLSLVIQLMNREEPAVIAKPIPILGGKSVFCINEEQMYEATRLREAIFFRLTPHQTLP